MSSTIAPEPVQLTRVSRFDRKGIPDPEGVLSSFKEYEKAMLLMSSDKLNGRTVTNANFVLVIDLLKNALACLQAISEFNEVEGTVVERLEHVRKVAGNANTEITNKLKGL